MLFFGEMLFFKFFDVLFCLGGGKFVVCFLFVVSVSRFSVLVGLLIWVEMILVFEFSFVVLFVDIIGILWVLV